MAECRIVAEAVEVLDEARALELCQGVCPTGALRVAGSRVAVEPGLCPVCVACMAACGPDVVRVRAGWRCSGD